MAEVVIVGAGLAGLSTAARLAKLGHRVVVCERHDTPGGLLRRVRHDGYEWDATPMQTTIPAVLRDLFRKSGRPIEQYADLTLSSPARRHVFPDGTVLDLPTGSRAAQLEAVSAAFGAKAGAAWTTFVDNQSDVWDLTRSLVLDVPDGATKLSDRKVVKALRARHSLAQLVGKALDDDRLRLLAAYPANRMGRPARSEPSFRAVEPYVERTFGVWQTPHGASDLAQALLTRMAERSVEVRLGCEVVRLTTSAGRVTGVALSDGSTLSADIVVTAVTPAKVWASLLPGASATPSASLFAPSRTTQARSVTRIGLGPDAPTLPGEVALHGDPLLVLSTRGSAPAGHHAWTVVRHGSQEHDPLDTMAERGIDIRDGVTTRLDEPAPAGPKGYSGGRSSYPLGWEGPRAAADRASLARPLPGLHCLGTGLVLGASIPYVAWQAAHVADLVGKA